MHDIALYYPYIHVREERWLKVAALYWPRMARVVPNGYPVADTDTARVLGDELGFIVPVPPADAARAVAPLFLEVLNGHQDRLVTALGGPVARSRAGDTADVPYTGVRHSANVGLAAVHWDEMDADLRDALIGAGLAVEAIRYPPGGGPPLPWVAMHPRLVWIYKCVLSAQVAETGQFTPTTDQDDAHLALHRWSGDQLLSALTGTPQPQDDEALPAPTDAVGLLAIRTVLPRDLDGVSAGTIAAVRRRHRAEFDAFHAAVGEAVDLLRDRLADVSLPAAQLEYTALEVERRFETPLVELRAALKGARIDTAFSAANLKFDLPAGIAAAGGGALAGQPLVGAAVGAAFGLSALRRSADQDRGDLRAAAPVASYLLSVEQALAPRSLLRRLTLRA
ncbi:DUF6236 family protein [Streptomyces sp. SBC-4]|nr:DUF6236 family protein [Streptomyces sp. SBC-4]MDV5147484.1 DUF6236 family protein [Streptomyces sp. SBC-4]